MKISNKRGLQQIAFNHSSDIEFKNVMNLYKKCTAQPSSFLVIDATFASDNLSRFRISLLERILKLMIRLEMENYNTILTDKQQNISIITSKYDKYEYLTGEEILTSYQNRIIEQAKFTYDNQRKALEEYGKQLINYCDAKESLTHLKQKEIFEELANKRMEEIRYLSKQIDFDNLTYHYKGKNAPKML